MLMIKITACAVLTALLSMMLKNHRPELSLIIGLAGGTILLLMAAEPFGELTSGLKNALNTAGADMQTLALALKILGTAIIAEMGANLCRDAGLSSAAMKTELAGKILIVCMMLPTLSNLIGVLGGLIA